MTLAVVPPSAAPASWDALLPCPFCNGPARLHVTPSRHESAKASCAWCECTRCEAASGLAEYPNETLTIEQAGRRASRAWNRRGNHQGAEWKLQRIAQILSSDYAVPAEELTTAKPTSPGSEDC